MEKEKLNNLVEIIGKFKDLKREGWIKRAVRLPESDAEHSFSVAFLAFLLAPQKLDRLKCLELALTHDLAEIYAGDVTPVDKVDPEEKYRKERAAVEKIAQELGDNKLVGLFEEFESCKTPEAVFIKALDKLDNVVTACYYDENARAPQKLVPEFSEYAAKQIAKLECPQIEEILDKLI